MGKDNGGSGACGIGRHAQRSLAIVGVASLAAVSHMWIVQAGERPVRLNTELRAAGARSAPAPRTATPETTREPRAEGEAEPETAAIDVGFDPDALGLEITTEEAFELWSSGTAMFVDTRIHREYEAGHIPGALWIPASLFSRGRTPEAVGFLDPSMPLVLYCGGGDCDASKNTALLLEGYGFERLHIYTDGLPAWIDAGHEIEDGPDPITGGQA